MKIYLASSCKNRTRVKTFAMILREYNHEVDAFCDASTDRNVFSYLEIENVEHLDAIDFLKDHRVNKAFEEDKKWLDWCECLILILPSGKSSHLEAGYIKGQNKKLIIWNNNFPDGEFDVMYGFADLITTQLSDVIFFLEKIENEKNNR